MRDLVKVRIDAKLWMKADAKGPGNGNIGPGSADLRGWGG